MEVVLFAATWIHLEIIIQNEVTQKEKDKCHMVSFLCIEGEGEVAQSCPTLCDPVNCTLPCFSIHWNLQARILEWVTISFSGDLPDPGIEPGSPALEADALTSEPPGKPNSFHC